MMPVVFRIPLLNWDVPGYGLVLMLGFLASVLWAARRAARSGADPDVVLNCAFIALLGGVAGARFMHVVDYWDQFRYHGHWFNILWAILDVRKGGLEVYGGLIAALLGVLCYLLLWRHSVRWYLDIIAPSAALGMGLGRIGCFLNGCCWGEVCELPWAVRFPFGSNAAMEQWYAGEPGVDLPKELMYFPPNGIGPDGRSAYLLSRDVFRVTEREIAQAEAAYQTGRAQALELEAKLARAATEAEKAQVRRQLAALATGREAAAARYGDIREQMRNYGVTLPELQQLARQHPARPVHPTQLYSTVALVLLALALNALYWRRTRDGQVICALFVLESFSRFALEGLRADNPVVILDRFTISQFLAIVLAALGLLSLLIVRALPPRSPRARLWEPPDQQTPGREEKGRPARARA